MGDAIDLNAERKKRTPSYLDVDAIEAALNMLDAEADNIARGSMRAHGAVDVLANEICCFTSAIRRAIESFSPKEQDQ